MTTPRVTAEPLSDFAVRLSVEIKRPPEKVFEAWTDPSKLARWFVPEPNATCEVHEINPIVGGSYRFTVDANGPCTAFGEYQVIDRPRKLVFTWRWDPSALEPGETLVTLDFVPIDEGTRLVLTHERLNSLESREAHTGGWTGCLAMLAQFEIEK